jgi:hypothetical protein
MHRFPVDSNRRGVRRTFYRFRNALPCLLVLFAAANGPRAQTLEDIRRKLNMAPRNAAASRERENLFEIKRLRPGNIQGWKVRTAEGRSENLYGIEVQFEVHRDAEAVPVPCCWCYFYDRDGYLIDRLRVSMIYRPGQTRASELEGDLVVPGEKTIRAAIGYPATFHYKYAICVIGNEDGVDVMCYPRSTDYREFEFDEKSLVYPREP